MTPKERFSRELEQNSSLKSAMEFYKHGGYSEEEAIMLIALCYAKREREETKKEMAEIKKLRLKMEEGK